MCRLAVEYTVLLLQTQTFHLIFKKKIKSKSCMENMPMFNPIRPGEREGRGAQTPGWPNSELPFRNLLPYDAHTLWLLVFIFETCSDQIWSKLVNQGACCCSFLIEMSGKNFENEKFSSAWKLLQSTWRVNFGSKRTNLDIETHFFQT